MHSDSIGMHRVSFCLVALFVCAACSLLEPDTTIQVQGQVTAADDGSPIAGASVELRLVVPTSIASWTSRSVGSSTTDAQGHYSLSYVKEGRCGDLFVLVVNTQGFTGESIGFLDGPHLTCTGALQTFDVQLKRLINPKTAGG